MQLISLASCCAVMMLELSVHLFCFVSAILKLFMRFCDQLDDGFECHLRWLIIQNLTSISRSCLAPVFSHAGSLINFLFFSLTSI